MLNMLAAIVGAVSSVPLVLFVYSRYVAQKPHLYVKVGTKLSVRLRRHLAVLEELYTPTWWCPFGFMQTAVRQVFRSCPTLPWEREIMQYSDGGVSGLDWLHPKNESDTTPVIIFLPGIVGSTHEASYLLHCAQEMNERGWRVAVANARGLGGVELKTTRTYNASTTDDIKAIIAMTNERYPKAKKLGCGFSLGGMILWNYLAKCQTAEEAGLHAATIISSPWNSLISTRSIETFFPRVFFNQAILRGLVGVIEPYKEMFDKYVDWDRIRAARTIRDFDKAFIVPMFGYKDWEEYYHDSALYYKVHRIPIPTVAVNAMDDCFAPTDTIPFDDICRSENVAAVITAHGGHTAFMQDANPSAPGFVEKYIVQLGEMLLSEEDEKEFVEVYANGSTTPA